MKAVKKHGRKLVVAAGVLVATFAGVAGTESGSKKPKCEGKERWMVKTLQDDDAGSIDFDSPTKISIADILEKERGDAWATAKNNPRLEDEFEVFKVRGKIEYVADENDGDIHIQLTDEHNPDLSIIAEIPNPACKINEDSEYKDLFRDARNDFLNKYQDESVWSKGVFEIVGVMFHDKRNHGHGGNQEGVELHPVISIKKVKKIKAMDTTNEKDKKVYEKESRMTKYIGALLILISIAGFITTAIMSMTNLERIANGTLPAISFLILIIGIAFYFPTMLEEAKGEISTMRIVVLIVVLVFGVVYVKLGWVAGSFEEFFIDTSWIYILGLAFGSKAFQKFAEEKEE